MGIIGTFALPKITEYRHHRAFRVTQDHQERIVKSLESYLVKHEVLPRPDDFPKNYSEKFPQNNLKVMGIIPYDELGLPESVAKDGYGNFMTYVVANDACGNPDGENQALPFCKPYQNSNHNLIIISDGKNDKIIPTQKNILKNVVENEPENSFLPQNKDNYFDSNNNNYIAFAVISHGPEGLNHAGGLEEEKNNQAHFVQNKIELFIRPYSVNPKNLFRHQIVWGTQHEFAGFCKSQKIMRAFDRFQQTFIELKSFMKTMETSSNIFNKLEKLISKIENVPVDQKQLSNPFKIKNGHN